MKIVNRMPRVGTGGLARPQETGGCFMKIVTAAKCAKIDRATSERFGVHSLTSDEIGRLSCRFVLSHYSSARRIVVICGEGTTAGMDSWLARDYTERKTCFRLSCSPIRGAARRRERDVFQSSGPSDGRSLQAKSGKLSAYNSRCMRICTSTPSSARDSSRR